MNTFANSRGGALYGVRIELGQPPLDNAPRAVHVMSDYGHDWRSAHRAAAAKAYGTTVGKVTRATKMEHYNTDGVLVVHSWWYGPVAARSLNLED